MEASEWRVELYELMHIYCKWSSGTPGSERVCTHTVAWRPRKWDLNYMSCQWQPATQRIHYWYCKWGRWHHMERAFVSVKQTKKLLQQSESLKTINMMYFVHWASDVPYPPSLYICTWVTFQILKFPLRARDGGDKEIEVKHSIFLFTQRRSVHIQNQRVEMRWDESWDAFILSMGVGGWDGNDTFLIPRDAVFTFSIVLRRRESSAAERGKGIFAFIKKKL